MALYGMVDNVTSYGLTVGTIVDMVSELRGNVSAMASMTTPPTYADASITIEEVSFLCLQWTHGMMARIGHYANTSAILFCPESCAPHLKTHSA